MQISLSCWNGKICQGLDGRNRRAHPPSWRLGDMRQLTRANENQEFWSIYAVKVSGSTVPTVETDNTMNLTYGRTKESLLFE
jgi:hypothetical protein